MVPRWVRGGTRLFVVLPFSRGGMPCLYNLQTGMHDDLRLPRLVEQPPTTTATSKGIHPQRRRAQAQIHGWGHCGRTARGVSARSHIHRIGAVRFALARSSRCSRRAAAVRSQVGTHSEATSLAAVAQRFNAAHRVRGETARPRHLAHADVARSVDRRVQVFRVALAGARRHAAHGRFRHALRDRVVWVRGQYGGGARGKRVEPRVERTWQGTASGLEHGGLRGPYCSTPTKQADLPSHHL